MKIGAKSRTQIAIISSALILLTSIILALSIGPVNISFTSIIKSFVGINNLTGQEHTVLFDLRLPRIILGIIVGAALATSGAVYQTVFRNPLADPYLLGAAAGAGLGATLAFITARGDIYGWLPIFAFVGSSLAVLASFFISGRFFADPQTLLLSGIAVGSFATAIQTYLQQRHSDLHRPVYNWILGELVSADWQTVSWTATYVFVALLIILAITKKLDALYLTDDEALSLGVNPQRIRIIAICGATLATATAVAASGLIGFVGIVVPHLVRGITHEASNRLIPAIALAGGSFIVLADLGARTILSPAELPIGVITALIGAPFFLVILRSKRMAHS